MPPVFTWSVRVYYEDTDAGGIVYYANYLKYFERARTEWLRSLGISQQAMLDEDGAAFVVRNVSIDYVSAARLDDALTLTLEIEKLGPAAVRIVQHALRGDTLLASGSVKVGCVDIATLRPRAVPEAAAARMRASRNPERL